MPVLPDSLLRMLADVDDPRRLALVAELDHADGGDVVALGNVSAIDDDRAEVGLVVADAWQRQGIGAALAARLLQAAEVRGYHREGEAAYNASREPKTPVKDPLEQAYERILAAERRNQPKIMVSGIRVRDQAIWLVCSPN